MTPAIFLDFDGVLNNMPYIYECERAIKVNEGRWSHADMLDPARIARLNTLVERTGAEVVISSSWRCAFGLRELAEMLTARGATFRPIDVTSRPFATKGRDHEIRTWLDDNPTFDRWVVLDDGISADMGDGSFVLVPHGLEDEHVELAVAVLERRAVKCATTAPEDT